MVKKYPAIHVAVMLTVFLAFGKVTGGLSEWSWWKVTSPLWVLGIFWVILLIVFYHFKYKHMARSQGHVELRHSGLPNEFYTRTVAENGRVLSSSEVFGDRQTAINNIRAELNLYSGDQVAVREVDADDHIVRRFTLLEDGGIVEGGTVTSASSTNTNETPTS